MNLSTPLSQVIRTTRNHLFHLEQLGVKTIGDLLQFYPRLYEDKREYTPVVELRTDQVNNVRGIISNLFHKKTKSGKLLSKGLLSDGTGSVEVVWFNQPFLKRVLTNGQEIILSGKAKFNLGKISLQSPTYEFIKGEQMHSGRLVPVYHQTDGITSKWIREKLKPVIDKYIVLLEDPIPPQVIAAQNLIGYQEAVKEVHFPTDEGKLEDAQKRLSFDELFLLQIKALQKKWHWQNIAEHEKKKLPTHMRLAEFFGKLPFQLTMAQKKSLTDILADLDNPYPMSRLLQGDVGSGKTVVAGAAILNTVFHGYQAALMAPTEILARQHYNTLHRLFHDFGLNIQFISGSTTESVKKEILTQLAVGTIDLIIGTHSIIQEGVKFAKLGLAVIDEQHRFGVKQRDLLKKSGSPHLLALSATPIPRTLAMTIYGDQDLSVIDEMPQGRQIIITRIVPENKRIDAYRWIENQVEKGRQAFVICPLIDESDILEVKSAIQEFEYLQKQVFPGLKLGLLHGKMKSRDKEEIMRQFAANKINILVSTSVIEVGIDVPNASIMMIEGADRFGLSQLHQFRGRVGRGEHQSYCFLFTRNDSPDSVKRLKAMVEHSSGFKLAEIDLHLRGPGEIYGVKQSGIPDLKMASLTDTVTIEQARKAAAKLLAEDPFFKKYPKLQKKLQSLEEVYVND